MTPLYAICFIVWNTFINSCTATREASILRITSSKDPPGHSQQKYSPRANVLNDWAAAPISNIINIIITVVASALVLGCVGVCVGGIAYRLSLCNCCCRRRKKSTFGFDPLRSPHLISPQKQQHPVVPPTTNPSYLSSNPPYLSNPRGVFVGKHKHAVPPESPSVRPEPPPRPAVRFHSDGRTSPKPNLQISQSASPSNTGSSGDRSDQAHVVALQHGSPLRPKSLADRNARQSSQVSTFSETATWTLTSERHGLDYSLPNTLPPLEDEEDNMLGAVEMGSVNVVETTRSFGEQLRIAHDAVRTDIDRVPKSSDLDKHNGGHVSTATATSTTFGSLDLSATSDRVTVVAGEAAYGRGQRKDVPTVVPIASQNQSLHELGVDQNDDELYYSAESLPGPRQHSESSLGFINITGIIGSVTPSLKDSVNPKLRP